MAHKIDLQLDKNLPKETDLAIKLIVSLTGGDPSNFTSMSEDEIFVQLSYLMKCEKEKIQELFREHDQNEALDLNELSRLWKLNSKNIVKGRRSKLGSTPPEFFEKILLLMGRRADAIRIASENNVGNAITSEVMNNTKPISLKNHKTIYLPPPSQPSKVLSSSNDNSNTERSF